MEPTVPRTTKPRANVRADCAQRVAEATTLDQLADEPAELVDVDVAAGFGAAAGADGAGELVDPEELEPESDVEVDDVELESDDVVEPADDAGVEPAEPPRLSVL
jgi:hypothetical protein